MSHVPRVGDRIKGVVDGEDRTFYVHEVTWFPPHNIVLLGVSHKRPSRG